MQTDKPYILHLPKWYPTLKDEQFGVFTEKHIKSSQSYCKNVVVSILAASDKSQHYQVEKRMNEGIEEYVIFYPACRGKGAIGRMFRACSYLKAFRRIWKSLKKEHGTPDLVHAHVLLNPGLLARLVKFFTGIPYVITEHWTGYASGAYEKKSFLYRYYCRLCVRKAAGLSVVSSLLADAMQEKGLYHRNTEVIPNVIDVFPPLSLPKEKHHPKAVILTVADLTDKNKNISGSLRALKAIQDLGLSFEYHIIGGGHDEAMLKELIEELGLGMDTVIFHGRQSNQYVLDFIPSCDFLLVNSRVETFCVVAAEALACGKPVIVTKCGGPETFVNNHCGLVIDKDDQEALQDALEDMVQHYRVYKPSTMQAQIHELFNEEKIGKAWKDFYEHSLKS